MKAKIFSWLVLTVCLLAGHASFSAEPPPAQTASHWRIFPSGARYPGPIRAMDDRYLWSGWGWCGQIEQYDMQEKKLRVFTDADGLPLSRRGVETIRTAGDGRCLLILDGPPALHLFEPANGWSTLPPLQPDERYRKITDAAIDTDNTVVALARATTGDETPRMFRLGPHGWDVGTALSVPSAGSLIAFPEGFVVKGYDRETKRSNLYFVPRDDLATAKILPGDLQDENGLGYYRVGKLVYLSLPPPIQDKRWNATRELRVMQNARRVTIEGILEDDFDQPLLLDLKTESFEPFSYSVDKDLKLTCRIEGAADLVLDAAHGIQLFPIRDKNGDLRMSRWSYREGAWSVPHATKYEVKGIQAIDRDRYYFDEPQQLWKQRIPQGWADFSGWDAATKRAWALKNWKSPTMEYLDFSVSPPANLRTIARKEPWRLPLFRDRQGHWWLIGDGVIRIDANDQVTRYSIKSPSGLWLSLHSGNVWTLQDNDYLKYDAKENAFVSTDEIVWDDFAFRIGPYELAMLPHNHDISEHLMRKFDGKWQIWRLPYELAPITTSKFARLGDRMLISQPYGTWEYDGQKNRWVRLHPVLCHVGFDDQGRRMLTTHHAIMVYDGDPFESPEYLQIEPLVKVQETTLAALSQLVRSDDARLRKLAEPLYPTLTPLIIPQIDAAIADPAQSNAVRQALRDAIKNMKREQLIPGLFELAHPPCPFKEFEKPKLPLQGLDP